jgi:hypothetical protein
MLGRSYATFRERRSLLKKWLSAWSALKESPKTRLNRYENAVFGP